MKNILNILIISFLFVGINQAQKVDEAFFNDVNSFLGRNIKNGLVDYQKASKDGSLVPLIQKIQKADLSNATDNTKKAFYINAYNLYVINLVSFYYPTPSPMDITGFFDTKRITVAGEELTLNQLEKNKLLKPYNDPRFHFVLVCGAMGCPPITNFAYTPDKLEAQLEQQTSKSLNNPSFIKVSSDEVKLSQIFKWYIDDFGGNKATSLEFINNYRNTAISKSSDIGYYQYDWALNDAVKKK